MLEPPISGRVPPLHYLRATAGAPMALKSVKKPQKQETEKDTPSAAMRQKIAELAYYRAEQRGFSPGYELEDWLAAEAEVKKSAFGRLE
jgi:hypothetical protein